MKWLTKNTKGAQYGRVVLKSFCFLPKKIPDGVTIWLGWCYKVYDYNAFFNSSTGVVGKYKWYEIAVYSEYPKIDIWQIPMVKINTP